MGGGFPPATTIKVTGLPAATVCDCGCVLIVGGVVEDDVVNVKSPEVARLLDASFDLTR